MICCILSKLEPNLGLLFELMKASKLDIFQLVFMLCYIFILQIYVLILIVLHQQKWSQARHVS